MYRAHSPARATASSTRTRVFLTDNRRAITTGVSAVRPRWCRDHRHSPQRGSGAGRYARVRAAHFRSSVKDMHPRTQVSPSSRWWTAMLGDVQFWVPFAVLLIGLLLLRLVQ